MRHNLLPFSLDSKHKRDTSVSDTSVRDDATLNPKSSEGWRQRDKDYYGDGCSGRTH